MTQDYTLTDEDYEIQINWVYKWSQRKCTRFTIRDVVRSGCLGDRIASTEVHDIFERAISLGHIAADQADWRPRRGHPAVHFEFVDFEPSVTNPAAVSLYRLYDQTGELLYVGLSVDWTSRMRQHERSKDWFAEVARVDIEHHPASEIEEAERRAIETEHPLHNVKHNALALS